MQHSTTTDSTNIAISNVLEIVSMLGERYVLDILDAASDDPKSAKELAHDADVPTTTLYRRLDGLVATGLVEESMRMDGDGDHYHVYRATLDHLSLTRGEDGLLVDLGLDVEDAAERWDGATTAMQERA